MQCLRYQWRLFSGVRGAAACNSCSVSYEARIAKMPSAVHGAFIPVTVFEYPPSPPGKQWFVVLIFRKMFIMLKYLHFKYGKAGLWGFFIFFCTQ